MKEENKQLYNQYNDLIKETYRQLNKIGFVSPERRYEAPTVGMLGMCIV